MEEIEGRRSGSLERASDADREATLDFLRGHCSAGVLSLDEFSNRASRALDAVTRADLTCSSRTCRLQSPQPGTTSVSSGSSRLSDPTAGGESGELAAARPPSPLPEHRGSTSVTPSWPKGKLTVRAFALCGMVKVVVPKGIGVELTGVSLVGAQTAGTDARDLLPGAPVIRVKALPVLGSVRIISATSLRMRTLDRVEGRVKD